MPRSHIAWLPMIVLMIGVLAGCAGQPTEAPKAGEKPGQAAPTEAPQTAASPAAPASPAPAAKTAPAPAASPAAPARGEPQGSVVYGWHTSLTPAWLDPQENPAFLTQYGFQYAIHDALAKHMPGQVFASSLAESYQIANDFKSATFKLRPGIKFHNGDPVTPEDVKFTFENYRGANAKALKDKTERIETPDPQTVRFVFNEPFLDFQVLYASPASGAGWIVPKNYYEQVGPDGFKNNPIGAGPYKVVRHAPGSEIELEAFTEYWRKTPHVKTLIFKAFTEDATRVAGLQTGEADFINLVPGQLIDAVRQDPNLQLAPTLAGPFWLEFPGFENPDNPFNKKQVREAVSLALDRKALSEAETAGFSPPIGNWIPNDWPGAIEGPEPKHDPARAKQLMAEAGFPDGFEVEALTPLPPYFSFGERVITQLRAIGIQTKLNQMERGAFFAKIAEGPGALQGMILNVSGAPGDAASRIRAYATCNGASSRTCVPEIDEMFQQYENSTNPQERQRLLTEVQQFMIDNQIFVPVYRLAFINAQGPRIANPWEEIIASVPQYVYVGPYEDVRLKE